MENHVILKIDRVGMHFGGLEILKDVSLEVKKVSG